MSDDDTTTDDSSTGNASATDGEALGDAGKTALATERQARRAADRELKQLRTRLQEFEDRDKTDLQRAQDALTAAEQRAAAAEQQLLRATVAAKHNLGDLAEFLTGADEKTLEAQAAKLAERLGAGRPASFDGGPRGSGGAAPTDMNALIRRAAGLG